ncbi:sensor histidine kinase [Kallotenue papyrolyticum]|uniref:sensor histidine kinase n=1 Tax=Kallotenue papyrolyticum TaxID=1325125 RepID=UPI00047865C5|nr:ATP-binding protein [Kallotenue papyrolyticum]
MNVLRTLRWKLFISHLLIIVIAVVVLLLTARFLASTSFAPPDATLSGQPLALDEAPPAHAPNAAAFQSILEQSLLVAAFAALGAAVIVSLFVSHRIVQPLQVISQVSRRMAQGSYHERTVLPSDDELAELSRSINQLAEALEHTERRRMALIADVAHELRTPLTTIEGYMEGLLDGMIQPGPRTYSLVLRESARLQRLVNELALLSRIEAGEIQVRPRMLALADVVTAVSEQIMPLCEAQHLRLVVDLPRDLPPIWADPDRLSQILLNLLGNALRYTPVGGTITISARPLEGAVQITVRDTGIGIAPEHLPHLFERFYRVDKSRTRSSGGTGIGLTIARHLVHAHGGEIWAESDGPGTGAAFHLTLPALVTDDVLVTVA